MFGNNTFVDVTVYLLFTELGDGCQSVCECFYSFRCLTVACPPLLQMTEPHQLYCIMSTLAKQRSFGYWQITKNNYTDDVCDE